MRVLFRLTNHLSKNFSISRIKLNTRMVSQVTKPRPLVLILPWLNASNRGIEKYAQIYKDAGMDVMVHKVELKDFLWPKTGLASSKNLLAVLVTRVAENGPDTRPLIVHSFSVGCYFYALMIMNMRMSEKSLNPIPINIVAQIIDSPVIGSLKEMAFGVSKMLSPNSPTLSSLYKNACLGYFALSRPFTVSIYDESIYAIKHQSPKAPLLVLSSKNDPMHIPKALDDFVDIQREQKLVTYKVWEKSVHAQHLREHPTEYRSILMKYLDEVFSSDLPRSRL